MRGVAARIDNTPQACTTPAEAGSGDDHGQGSAMRSTITTERSDGATTVRLVGEIDLSLREQAAAALDAVQVAARPVVLDLAGVTFIDSSGVSFLLQCRKVCARDGLAFQVRDVPPRARRTLEVLGLVEVLAVG